MSKRTLSKKDRAMLWFATPDQRCQICGNKLDPTAWEADHVEAFVKTGRTNIHEMQALCISCNKSKGKR